MTQTKMVQLRNKKTGEIITVPRSQYIVENDEKGLKGVSKDILESAYSAPQAFGEMVSSIPGAVKNVGKYAMTTNPVSTLANLGAGGVEGGAALLSSPEILARYLKEKFPDAAKGINAGYSDPVGNMLAAKFPQLAQMLKGRSENDPTIYEKLMSFEKEHGLAPQSEEEASVRSLGNLIFGGKGLTKLPGAGSRIAAVSAQQAGAGGDPVHAAILAALGEKMGSYFDKKRANANQQLVANAQNLPPTVPPAMPSATIADSFNQPILPGLNVTMGGFGLIPEAVKAFPKVAEQAKEGAQNIAQNAREKSLKGAASTIDFLGDVGGVIPVVGKRIEPITDLLSTYLNYKSVSPEVYAIRKLLGDIKQEDLPIIEERMKAKEELPLTFLTPGEALRSPFQAAKEANVGKTARGSALLLDMAKKRTGSQADAITKLEQQIYDPENLDPKKKAAYDDAMSQTVPNDFINKWKQNDVVKDAIKLMGSKGTYTQALKGVPENSFQYWNYVKRAISEIEKGDAKGLQKWSSDEATKTRNKMVSEMDLLYPPYKNARNIAEREFTKEIITKALDKKNYTINDLQQLFKSRKGYEELHERLDPYPEAQKTLEYLKDLSGNLLELDDSIRTAYKLEKTGMTKERNKFDALKRALDQKYGEEYDVETVKLMTGDWLNKLRKELSKKGK